ncbi:MAG: helix-turn-helix domain-containing protein [Solobacterium sp.]|nr:helix-turn-helix domain-containing protein [Solobacterium sp.]
MEETVKIMERMFSVTGITLSLLDGDSNVLCACPAEDHRIVQSAAGINVLNVFRQNGCDLLHPLILFIDPGLLLGIIMPEKDRYILIGPVSPYIHSRSEILKAVSHAIHPEFLQRFCDRLLQQPLVSTEKMKDLICLLTRLYGLETAYENIQYLDIAADNKVDLASIDRQIFEQRESAEYHVPQNFEQAICAAVEKGDRAMLERTLFSPVQGKIGRMSVNEMRQQKYAFICLATLVSRAAIRGGLEPETAFSLSDLYCQRIDLLTDPSLIQNMTMTMLTNFCEKVRENNKRPDTTPVIENCLRYISAHLHEPIRLDDLSLYCGLCTRSLSIRFKEEMGMRISDFIHMEKMKEAKYLLRHTDYSLLEITTILNYPSQSYFTQIFRKNFDQTPLQYRENRKSKPAGI